MIFLLSKKRWAGNEKEMGKNWDQNPIYVIDFEGSVRSGIVEYGIVALLGCQIEGVETRICQPTGRIVPSELETHGISLGDSLDTAPFSDEWERFASIREKGPLVAHYASAENSMLKSVFAYPRVSKNWVRPGESIADWGPWLDTWSLYKTIATEGDSLNLQTLVRKNRLQDELDEIAQTLCPEGRQSYHCALYDALASALLLIAFCQDIKGGQIDFQQLAILSKSGYEQRKSASQSELF
ncbi:hypothetical protein MLD52_20205 [Puniceicoccaceae bacterium K14]|nr:hypothetical protein [Puniceicoccaceae bacterium K14]